LSGLQDAAAIFSLRTWLFGWFLRVVAQVIFFGFIGRLVGSHTLVSYLVVGNAVALTAQCCIFAVPSTTWERRTGTLPLLVAAPTTPLLVFMGRSLNWILEGLASSIGALLITAPLFGVTLPWPRALWVAPLLLVVALSTYLMAICLGALVLRAMDLRNVVSNLALHTIFALGGVNVPTSFFPAPLEALAALLPVTHGLTAIRGLLAGAPARVILSQAALEALVGLGWLILALLAFRALTEGGRHDGSIEFAA
jgi:ABC-2 type transport system permease protein